MQEQYNGNLSDFKLIKYGVPQGLNLSPYCSYYLGL